jgi:DNA-binding transcriptional LysR family regulator
MAWDEKIGRRLKLKDLQTLIAVVEAGGISKAGDHLNYSQSAVSKAIATLERALGKRLLDRGRKGIELTPYGDAVFKGGRAVFDDLRKAVADIEFLSDPTAGEVHIGCTEPVSAGFVSSMINRFSRTHPRVVFDVIVSDPNAILRELDARRIHFAIAQIVERIDEDRLLAETLYDESVTIVAGVRHPLANKRRLRLADIVDARWVLPPSRTFITPVLAQAFAAEGLKLPPAAATSRSAYWRVVLTVEGQFLTVVPDIMLKSGFKHLPIKALPVKLRNNRRPVSLITLKDRGLSPVAQRFIEHARSFTKSMAKS